MSVLDVVEATRRLVQIPSVTSEPNQAVSAAMAETLEALGFTIELFDYIDAHGLAKQAIAASRNPAKRASLPPIGYFCHNDVVSLEGWDTQYGDALECRQIDDRLYGRGSCDMKGSAAAALAAISRIGVAEQTVPLYFFVTGDEESGMLGADQLSEHSSAFHELVDAGGLGIIGEPTSLEVVTAHKGALHIDVTSHGTAAHSSTRDGHNANWQLFPFLSYLHEVNQRCLSDDSLKNDSFDPPTLSLNVVVENEPTMANITVGRARVQIFLRPMPDTSWEDLLDEIVRTAKVHKLSVNTLRPMRPLQSDPNSPNLKKFMQTVGSGGGKSVCYATDGCCLGALADMVVYGPGSIEQAHRNDEWISLDQLHRGTDMYERVFRATAP